MYTLKELNNFRLSNADLLNFTHTNPLQEALEQTQRERERTLRDLQNSKEEKETERLHQNNEMIAAIERAAKNCIINNFGDYAKDIHIIQDSSHSTQKIVNTQDFNYDGAYEALKEIRSYFDLPQFEVAFKEGTESIKQHVQEAITAVEIKEEPTLIKKTLDIIKNLAIGVSGSLIASGIVELINGIHVFGT